MNTCRICGGQMIGYGNSEVSLCEHISDISEICLEPDSGPVDCADYKDFLNDKKIKELGHRIQMCENRITFLTLKYTGCKIDYTTSIEHPFEDEGSLYITVCNETGEKIGSADIKYFFKGVK